jgi:hypothetical protein
MRVEPVALDARLEVTLSPRMRSEASERYSVRMYPWMLSPLSLKYPRLPRYR